MNMRTTEVPDIPTSRWRYLTSLWRALDRERLEFFETSGETKLAAADLAGQRA